MLWNWYTVDACFLSRTWRITSRGMFAESCIGVIFLVISLEFLRRMQREYDSYIRLQDIRAMSQDSSKPILNISNRSQENGFIEGRPVQRQRSSCQLPNRQTMVQRQLVRALIHMVQFAVAYFIMLLAMYYNGTSTIWSHETPVCTQIGQADLLKTGYIIFMIIVGAFLGSFIFTWDQMREATIQPADVTGCCG